MGSPGDRAQAVLLTEVRLSYLGLLLPVRDPDDVARDGRVRVQVISGGGEAHCHVFRLVKSEKGTRKVFRYLDYLLSYLRNTLPKDLLLFQEASHHLADKS